MSKRVIADNKGRKPIVCVEQKWAQNLLLWVNEEIKKMNTARKKAKQQKMMTKVDVGCFLVSIFIALDYFIDTNKALKVCEFLTDTFDEEVGLVSAENRLSILMLISEGGPPALLSETDLDGLRAILDSVPGDASVPSSFDEINAAWLRNLVVKFGEKLGVLAEPK
jgi:hypothetical protein